MWAPAQQNAFDKLKIKFTSSPVLIFPEYTKEFIFCADEFHTSLQHPYICSNGLRDYKRPLLLGKWRYRHYGKIDGTLSYYKSYIHILQKAAYAKRRCNTLLNSYIHCKYEDAIEDTIKKQVLQKITNILHILQYKYDNKMGATYNIDVNGTPNATKKDQHFHNLTNEYTAACPDYQRSQIVKPKLIRCLNEEKKRQKPKNSEAT